LVFFLIGQRSSRWHPQGVACCALRHIVVVWLCDSGLSAQKAAPVFRNGQNGWNPAITWRQALLQLAVLHSAAQIEDLDLPGYRLHLLKGQTRSGSRLCSATATYPISISRITTDADAQSTTPWRVHLRLGVLNWAGWRSMPASELSLFEASKGTWVF